MAGTPADGGPRRTVDPGVRLTGGYLGGRRTGGHPGGRYRILKGHTRCDTRAYAMREGEHGGSPIMEAGGMYQQYRPQTADSR